MTLFLDTSALVKLYLIEPGSASIQEQVKDQTVMLSHLTYGEIYATFFSAAPRGSYEQG